MNTSIFFGILMVSLLARGPQNSLGQGSIEGVVRNAETREPIADVEVSIAGNDAILLGLPTVRTDNNGRFVFSDVPPNKYTLIRQRFGYFTPKKDEWWEEHPKVEVGRFQRVTGVVLELIPGGAISGRVFDSKGEPVVGTRVFATEPRYVNGIRRLEGPAATTDEQGRYRIFGLFPGSYYLEAEYSPRHAGMTSTRVSFPGTFDEKASMPLAVRSGVELQRMDITFPAPPLVPTFTINGLVTGIPTGSAKTPRLRLTPPDAPNNLDELRVAFHQDRGRFQIRGVPAGIYDLYASMEDDKRNLLTAKLRVGVQGDSDNVTLALQRGVNVRVRIAVTGAPPRGIFKEAEPELVPVTGVFPLYYNGLFSILDGYRADKDSGEFVFPGVPPGMYKLKLPTWELPDGYVADIRQSGRSVFDEGFAVSATPPEPVEIVVGRTPGRVEGIVRDAGGKTAAYATVVLVPSLLRRNNSDLYVKWITDLSGKFSIPTVSPGEYKIFAWGDPPYGEPWQNSDFMAVYEAFGEPIQIGPNSETSVQLKVLPKAVP
jgi:hypothetical protein